MSVDFIVCRRVLHFVPPDNIQKALQNIRDIASPTALVCLSYDTTTYLNGVTFADPGRIKSGLSGYWAYKQDDIESRLRKLDFTLPDNIAFDTLRYASGDMKGDPISFRSEEGACIAVAPNRPLNMPLDTAGQGSLQKQVNIPVQDRLGL